MKKVTAIIITILALFLAQNSFTQDKGYIALSFGTNIPVGDFASSDVDNSSAGFATTGGISDISFGYKFDKTFGLTALIRGQLNPMDAQPLADEIANLSPDVFTTVETGIWGIGGLMLGGYGSFPLSDKISFDIRAMAGFLTATFPEITVNMSGPGGTAWVKVSETSTAAFSYLIGVVFKHDISDKVCILGNVDYLGSEPEFSDVETTSSFSSPTTDTFSQSFGTINIGIGIGLRL